MHRIGLRSLTRGHIEEARVEETRFVDKASIRSVARVTDLAVSIVMLSHIETVWRYLVTLNENHEPED